ncbi:alanine racemase [Acidobacteria bacterium AB60]|nr:alanine racemase [Acidobacteria bacterium AB60]
MSGLRPAQPRPARHNAALRQGALPCTINWLVDFPATSRQSPLRPCWAEIDTAAFEHNYRLLSSMAGPACASLAIVKANAYGHGLEICAPAAVRGGAQWLGVTSVEEGVAARSLCPSARILVMGGLFPGQAAATLAGQLTPVVWEPYQLGELERAAEDRRATLPVHLEIDTGMSRQGANLADLPAILARLAGASPLRLEAIMTHLYASDDGTGETTAAQLDKLERALGFVAAEPTLRPEFLSVGASAALLGGESDQIAALAKRFRLRPMVRIGIGLYGVAPRFNPPLADPLHAAKLAQAGAQLKPVLTWKTRITSVRSIPAGTQIGYNGTFVATEPMRLALLPIGYADGLDRRLSNRFSLLAGGQRAPLVGRISMDQAVLDITEIPGLAPGEEVVILGSQGAASVTAYDHADASGTVPWDVFTRIAARVARIGRATAG